MGGVALLPGVGMGDVAFSSFADERDGSCEELEELQEWVDRLYGCASQKGVVDGLIAERRRQAARE